MTYDGSFPTAMQPTDDSRLPVLQIDHDESGTRMPSFSPDSTMVAETNSDNQVRVWAVCSHCENASALLAASRSSLIAPLTPLERAEVASLSG
jgi:hypothetical protein